ncbi:MAG: YtxH domain-containing protein [Armatimonadetes bacterium]|nr:YtxH domain-containing protein [Armatimonadota bacterium]
MKKGAWLGLGVVAGAVAGLLLAPESGRRTRALIRDKGIKYSHDVADFADKKSRHMANKMKGYAHEVKDFLAEKAGVGASEEQVTGA